MRQQIGSADTGLSPAWRQVIVWTNTGWVRKIKDYVYGIWVLIGHLGRNTMIPITKKIVENVIYKMAATLSRTNL